MKKIIYLTLWLAFLPWVNAQQRSPEALFKQWDKNKDGKLLPAELPQNARRNFVRVDTNKDGAISLEEHVRFLKRPRNVQPRQPKDIEVLRDIPYAGTENSRPCSSAAFRALPAHVLRLAFSSLRLLVFWHCFPERDSLLSE